MKSITYLLPVLALALSGVAAAGSRDVSQVVVRYGDLNLNSSAGLKSLHRRIHNAAESVCGNLNSRILSLQDTYAKCVAEATANGVAAVGNPRLADYHASRGQAAVLASN